VVVAVLKSLKILTNDLLQSCSFSMEIFGIRIANSSLERRASVASLKISTSFNRADMVFINSSPFLNPSF
jgi:hypothetical protein